MNTPITVLHIDDHISIRESQRLLLGQFDIKVIGEADDGKRLLEDYKQLQPDIVILDLSIQGINGLDCTAQLIHHYPNARIIIFSMHDNSNFVHRAIESGAMAYVLKSEPSAMLVDAIKQVYYQSKPYLSPSLANHIALSSLHPRHEKLTCLSNREYSIFLLLAEGKSRYDIAAQLSLSIGTISNYKTKIFQKLNINSLIDLNEIALKSNLLKHNYLIP
jgi:DNA-binding NarL/FixJ family response regulator